MYRAHFTFYFTRRSSQEKDPCIYYEPKIGSGQVLLDTHFSDLLGKGLDLTHLEDEKSEAIFVERKGAIKNQNWV